MGRTPRIKPEIIERCQALIARMYDREMQGIFQQLLDDKDYEEAAIALKEALSDRDCDGFPRGRLGLPLDRAAAESFIRTVEGGTRAARSI